MVPKTPTEEKSRGLGLRERIDATSLLAALLERSSTPMFVADDERRYIEINRAACELLGYSRDELLEMKIEEISSPELRPRAAEMFEEFKTAGTLSGPYTVLTKDGDEVSVHYSATANVMPGIHLSICLVDEMIDSVLDQDGSAEDGAGRPDLVLTQREREVMTLLALGESNQTIASKLHLAPETVRNYTRSARQKLGAKSRSHAIAIAARSGQLDIDF